MPQAIMLKKIRHIPVGHRNPCFKYRGTTEKRIIPNKKERPITLLPVRASKRLSMQNIQYPNMIIKYSANDMRIISFVYSLFKGFPNAIIKIYNRE